MLYTSDLLRWLQRKRYQYEVTFSLYMLTPTEKFIFSMKSFCTTSITRYLACVKRSLTFATLCRFVPLPLPLHEHHRSVALST